MIYRKTQWKWHECLQARDETISTDSEYENDDSVKNTSIITQQKNLNNEYHQTSTNSNENILTKQQKLKEEAKYGLVLGAKIARMQVEIERQRLEKKRSSFYDIIGIYDKPLTKKILEDMNIGQLQVIVNDLYCQIEANNDELINLLIERDSLNTKQDSILVDIEDLTKRLQERTINFSTQSIHIVKHSQDVPKRSIFQNLLRKAMFI